MSNVEIFKAARETLEQALAEDWPTLQLSNTAKMWLLGQVWSESRFGSTPDWGTSNNWGAVIYHLKDGKFVQHGDRDKDGNPYTTKFQAYDTQLEAAKGWLKVILRGAVPTALVNGSVTDVARAMYANHYYTGTSGTTEDRVDAYARFIESGAAFARSRLAVADGAPDWSDIATYQAALQKLGLYDGAIDGISGPKTKAAIVEFQVEHQLKADGIVGPLTQDAIANALPGEATMGLGVPEPAETKPELPVLEDDGGMSRRDALSDALADIANDHLDED
jgi:hypothetical protein